MNNYMSIYDDDAKPGPVVCPFCKSDKHTRRIAYVSWSNEGWEVVRVPCYYPAYCIDCVKTFQLWKDS